eukprot:gene14939-16480_t
MKSDSNFVYIQVIDDEHTKDLVEIPSEDNGTLLLSTVQAQFPSTTGLRYKSEVSDSWRGVRISDGVLHPPPEGWGTSIFYVVRPKTDTSSKRKINESPGQKEPEPKQVRVKDPEDGFGDLIVLGLPFSATEKDMEDYFSQFGTVSFVEVKKNAYSGQSRGFGFIRFVESDSAEKVLMLKHTIMGRRCEVRPPRAKDDPHIPYKLFVGRLASGTTESDLRSYFEMFGELTDVYVPKPFRGFGFVTFASSESVKRAMGSNHVVKGAQLNMTFAEPKGPKEDDRYNRHSGGTNYNRMGVTGNVSRSPTFSPYGYVNHPRPGGRYADRPPGPGSFAWKGPHDGGLPNH